MENNLIQNLTVLKALPGSWDIFSFEKLVKDVSGGNKKTLKSDFLDEGEFAIVDQGQSLVAGYTNNTALLVKAPPPYIVFGDHTRALKYIDVPFAMGADGTKVLKSINDETVNGKYLYYFFLTLNIPNTGYNRHFKYLKSVKIPLPPLAEQKQIATILDAADSLRQKDQQLVEHYTALSQSLFLEMFGNPDDNPMGWEKTKLSQVCAIQGGYAFKSKDFVEGGVRLIKIANVNHEVIDWEEVDMLPISYLDKYSEYSLNVGDILMALTRPIIKSLGTVKAALVSEVDVPALLNQRVARFFPNPKFLNNSYLLRIIYSSYFKNKIEKCTSTSLQPNVSNKQVGAIEILVPPIDLQNQFAERIAIIEQQKQQAQTNLQKSEALFNSLLQRAFTGELTADKAA